MIGLPGRLELGEVFVGMLQKEREGVEFLQFLFVSAVEVGGNKSWILQVGDLIADPFAIQMGKTGPRTVSARHLHTRDRYYLIRTPEHEAQACEW